MNRVRKAASACLKLCKLEHMTRTHKNLIHLSVLAIVAACMYVEGPKLTDVAFLTFSLICEIG